MWLPCKDLAPKVKEVLALLTQSMLGKSVDYTPCGFCVGNFFFRKKGNRVKVKKKRKSNSPLCTHIHPHTTSKEAWLLAPFACVAINDLLANQRELQYYLKLVHIDKDDDDDDEDESCCQGVMMEIR